MIKKDAQKMSFDDFSGSLTPEMSHDLSEMNISYNRAYSIFKDILTESSQDELDDIGSMETMVKNIILDYTDELMAKEFSKYDSDWEA